MTTPRRQIIAAGGGVDIDPLAVATDDRGADISRRVATPVARAAAIPVATAVVRVAASPGRYRQCRWHTVPGAATIVRGAVVPIAAAITCGAFIPGVAVITRGWRCLALPPRVSLSSSLSGQP